MSEPPEDEQVSIVTEFVWFIRENKKWWLIPLVAIFLLLTVVILASANPAAAPFIYSLF